MLQSQSLAQPDANRDSKSVQQYTSDPLDRWNDFFTAPSSIWYRKGHQ